MLPGDIRRRVSDLFSLMPIICQTKQTERQTGAGHKEEYLYAREPGTYAECKARQLSDPDVSPVSVIPALAGHGNPPFRSRQVPWLVHVSTWVGELVILVEA